MQLLPFDGTVDSKGHRQSQDSDLDNKQMLN